MASDFEGLTLKLKVMCGNEIAKENLLIKKVKTNFYQKTKVEIGNKKERIGKSENNEGKARGWFETQILKVVQSEREREPSIRRGAKVENQTLIWLFNYAVDPDRWLECFGKHSKFTLCVWLEFAEFSGVLESRCHRQVGTSKIHWILQWNLQCKDSTTKPFWAQPAERSVPKLSASKRRSTNPPNRELSTPTKKIKI